MAEKVGSMFVELTLDGQKFSAGLVASQKRATEAGQGMAKSFTQTDQALAGMGKRIVQIASVAGIYKLTDSFLDAAKAAESYSMRLQALLGSQSVGVQFFEDMREYASKVPFEFEKIMQSATQLTGIMGSAEVKKWMPVIGDLAAATGLTIEDTTGQVMRMFSAGATAADMFRERGVLAMLGFQAGATYSTEETKKKLWEAWDASDSRFKGLTNNLANTWSGIMSMMNDTWFQFRMDFMDQGPYEVMKAGLRGVLIVMRAVFDKRTAQETGSTWRDVLSFIGKWGVVVFGTIMDAIYSLQMTSAKVGEFIYSVLLRVADGVILAAKGLNNLGLLSDDAVKGLESLRDAYIQGPVDGARRWQGEIYNNREAMKDALGQAFVLLEQAGNYTKKQAKQEEEAARKKQENAKQAQKLVEEALKQMQALNKNYFQEQESMMKHAEDMAKEGNTHDLAATRETLKRKLELLAEYYERSKTEIAQGARARSEEDRKLISDSKYVQGKMVILDAETASKKREIGRDTILNNAKINNTRLDMEGRMYMDMNQYSTESMNYQKSLLAKQKEQYLSLGGDKVLAAQWEARQIKDLDTKANLYRVGLYVDAAGQIANTFMQIAQAGGKQSEKAFRLYQLFAIAQATISGYMAYVKTLAEPALPYPSNVVMANIIAGLTAVQIGMIASAKPPATSYDEGGISTTPGIYYAGVPEAHVPLKGGKIPVEIGGGAGGVTVIMNNPVFQDLNTQYRTFTAIAETVVRRVAPAAVAKNYNDDGIIRQVIRTGR